MVNMSCRVSLGDSEWVLGSDMRRPLQSPACWGLPATLQVDPRWGPLLGFHFVSLLICCFSH